MSVDETIDRAWIHVAAALIERDGRYLLTQRLKGVHLAGLWEFPGGKREPGESLEECLRRELAEELGIDITPPTFVLRHQHVYPEHAVALHFFSCSILRGEPRPLGCAAVQWVKPEEFHRYALPPADQLVLDRILTEKSRRCG